MKTQIRIFLYFGFALTPFSLLTSNEGVTNYLDPFLKKASQEEVTSSAPTTQAEFVPQAENIGGFDFHGPELKILEVIEPSNETIAQEQVADPIEEPVSLQKEPCVLAEEIPAIEDDIPFTDILEEKLANTPLVKEEAGHTINFNDIPVEEFIRFVSKISRVNFIFDKKDLNFNISLSSGKSVNEENVLKALLSLLRVNNFWVKPDDDYYVIHKFDPKNPPIELVELEKKPDPALSEVDKEKKESPEVLASVEPLIHEMLSAPKKESDPYEFFVYKLKYHQGSEILDSMKQVAAELRMQPDPPHKLLNAIQSVQWVKATNSLLCSSDATTLKELKNVIDSLDEPLKQVFIEVLVIETEVSKNLEYGLQWAAGSKFKDRLGMGAGGFPPSVKPAPFSRSMSGINEVNTPTGLDQIPIGSGFDLGIIGDLICHKGKTFLSLGALASALQADSDSTIVLNQKIIAQDNKLSRIFVGDNIPFTGSVVKTVGQSQQTTANVEYRDIGVNLNITPMLGNDGMITLDLQEEISEAVKHSHGASQDDGGIRTTKTNMVTHVHVPDKHFLMLSGMIRNAKANENVGLPCLGGIPFFGSLFSKKVKQNDKRNMIIFVRPHVIRHEKDHQKISSIQRELHRSQSTEEDFDAGMELVPHMLPSK